MRDSLFLYMYGARSAFVPIRHYFPDIRANHRPGCWKQLPLPVPHCWQYRRLLESIATVCIMIADPSLEVCVPRHLSRLWGALRCG